MKPFSSHVNGYYDVADQLPQLLRGAAEQALAQQNDRKATLTTVAQFEAHRARGRANFLAAIGGLPERTGPLNPQCTGVIERQGYRIEKLIYESLPGFYVTALLYVPAQAETPAPAVIFVHGHHDVGKAAPEYQAVCIDLARNGFFVLAVDPPGQGERKQSYDPVSRTLRIPHCTDEHTYLGLQFVIGGASLARHFVWDVMRGIDYLETRPEIDASRIGITGNSGGGTQTSFLMMAEPRLAAAVPCTFIMTLASYLKTGQPQDSEQIVRGCFVDGPDHDDYLTLMAPKPVLVGAAAYDFFPLEGTLEAVQRAKAIYQLYNAEEKIDLAVAPTGHTYGPHLREAAVNWFRVHLQGEAPTFRTSEVETLPVTDLWCTPNGQILDQFPHSQTVFELNRQRVASKIPPRRPVQTQAELATHVQHMRQEVLTVLGIEMNRRRAPIYPRTIWQGEAEGYACEQIFFFSEPDIVVTGVLIHPHGEAEQTEIVLLEGGTNDIPREQARLQARLAANRRLFVFDPRGIGAVQARAVNAHPAPHNSEYKLACDAMMLNRSTLGMRVFDVLRAYDYLRSRPDVDAVSLLGVDSGAFFAYFAAALEDGISELTVENLLYSYQNWVDTREYDAGRYNLKIAAWGILPHFDLVDLLPCLSGRPCRFVNLRNAQGELQPAAALLTAATAQGYFQSPWQPEFSEVA
jgi:dienelactone hydrolase